MNPFHALFIHGVITVLLRDNIVILTNMKDEFYFSDASSDEFKSIKGERKLTRSEFPYRILEDEDFKLGMAEDLDNVFDAFNACILKTEDVKEIDIVRVLGKTE